MLGVARSSYSPIASEEYSSELKQQLKDACERISQLEGRLEAAEAEAAAAREQLQKTSEVMLVEKRITYMADLSYRFLCPGQN